ncbi:hypothetical protein VNI00_014844 [Paramarasmius palmivorus]|uniref:Uncharacterized protein n=1 Tax=Paramarasmius palmivorus TaxID=297713 RepID=A0AAW0BP40_9AGAR
MPAAQHHMEYPPPVSLGPPSPASSVGSKHPDDTTSLSDSEDVLNDEEFSRKWEEKIGIHKPRPEEEAGDREPLLIKPPPNTTEEKILYERVCRNLRETVRSLGEDEIFQRTLFRGSLAGTHEPVATNDIDKIMRSMMGPPGTSSGADATTSTAGPFTPFPKTGLWSSTPTVQDNSLMGGFDSVGGSRSTMGRRMKGKGKR